MVVLAGCIRLFVLNCLWELFWVCCVVWFADLVVCLYCFIGLFLRVGCYSGLFESVFVCLCYLFDICAL